MKKILSRIRDGWKKFARTLGRVNTEIILFLFYFLIFTPFGLLLRLFGFDPLKRKLRKSTNWQDIETRRFDMEKASHQS